MKSLAVFGLFCLAVVPTAAQSASGTSALQYYVGTWSCVGKAAGQPATTATLTYTLDSGVLRQTLMAPKMGSMKQAYVSSTSTTYDPKGNRYLSAGVSNDPSSFTSMYTISGNTESSKDTWVSSGSPGRATTVRTNQNSFSYTGYATATATKPSFTATCKRSS